MSNLLTILILLIIIATIGILINNKNTNTNTKEHFAFPEEHNQWIPRWEGNTTEDCYNTPVNSCLKYTNCGICLNEGDPKCLPGDIDGPLFSTQCNRWVYSDYWPKHMFDEKITTNTLPFNHFYQHYEVYYPSPKIVSRLQ